MSQNTELFETRPINKAVIALVIPTIISQLITVVYNMADTFFIGQIGSSDQVAAVSLCMPLFLLLTGMANLFGIGGASLVSRCMGAGNVKKAANVSAFSIYTAVSAAALYGMILFAFRKQLLPLVGANEATLDYCSRYLFWAVTVGAVPTVLSAVLAHLIRAEGFAKKASFGLTMGGVLNIVLDPIFIFVFDLEIAGAAIATMLSNLMASLYFLVFLWQRKNTTVLSLNVRAYTLRAGIPGEVMLVGLPSCIMNLMGVFSNIVMNRLMASYCNEAVAGIGIAKKVDMLAFAIATGMSQGVLPLIGYNYSAKNYPRMMQAVKTAFLYSLIVALIGTVFLLTCAGPIVGAFIEDETTIQYGKVFQKIICITTPCVSVTMLIITLFQSVGQKIKPLILSLFRKGGLDVPFMFLMNRLIGVYGIAWATPISDLCAMLIAIGVFIPFWKTLKIKTQASRPDPLRSAR